jgi:hypothetical protein
MARRRKGEDPLARALGDDPPRELDQLSADDRRRLARTIEEARCRQAEELDAAGERALRLVPWPLRRTLGKVAGGR